MTSKMDGHALVVEAVDENPKYKLTVSRTLTETNNYKPIVDDKNKRIFVHADLMPEFHASNGVEYITHVAVNWDCKVHSQPRPNRHGDIMKAYYEANNKIIPGEAIQGFLTNTGRFVDRKEAAAVARHAGQITEEEASIRYLFSEDVW